MRNMRRRADLWILLLLAAALRVAFVADLSGQVVFSSPLVDARTYDDSARAVAAHGPGAIATPYYQPPLYPLLLGAVYASTGGSYLAPRILQSLLGLLTALLVAHLAARGGRRRAGWLAGALFAAYGPVLYFEGELLPSALLLASTTAAVWLLLEADDVPRPARGLVAAGLLLGIASAARPTGFLFAAGAAAWWAWRRRAAARRGWQLAWLAAAVAIPVLPFTIANLVRGGEPVLVSWNGGINFYLGNGTNPDSLTAIQPGYAWSRLQVEPFRDGVYGSRRAESSYWVHRALEDMAADPERGRRRWDARCCG